MRAGLEQGRAAEVVDGELKSLGEVAFGVREDRAQVEPVLDAKGKLTVGFKPDEYKKLFG